MSEDTRRISSDAESLRIAIQKADRESLSAAAAAVGAAGDEETRTANQKAYVALRTALIDASRNDPESWQDIVTVPDRTANKLAAGLFWARILITVGLIGALVYVTWLAVDGSSAKDGAGAAAPYVSLVAGLVGIALGWMFGATARPDTGTPTTKLKRAAPKAPKR